MPSHTLTFLGTGASCGVPSYYCGCIACKEALEDPRAARSCACVCISGTENTLIDASPDLRMQLVHAGIKDVERLLVTHEHFDHIGGIPQLEFYVKLQKRALLPVYAGAEALAAIERQFGFMMDVLDLHSIAAGESSVFDDVCYTPFPAIHSPGCLGYLVTTPATRLAYIPDTGLLDTSRIERLGSLDYLIIDATFNESNWMPHAHLSIDEAISLAQAIDARTTFLTHLAMHYNEPITLAQLEEKLAVFDGRIKAAYDGLIIPL